MTRFWLLRHGPTHAKTMNGWTDIAADLSDHAQIARLNHALPQNAPVISSDLTRAVATADCLTGRKRLPHDPDLREIHFGRWEGKSHDAISADPDEAARLRAFWESPGRSAAPGGESWDALYYRVNRSLDRLNGIAPEVIVVCHFGAILAALQRGLGCSAVEIFAHSIAPLSLSRLCLTQPPQVETINYIA